jgi:hypothetical protein
MFQAALEETSVECDRFRLELDRFRAVQLQESTPTEGTLRHSIFGQMYRQVHRLPPRRLRHDGQLWTIRFAGESGIDAGGLWRESVTQLVQDLELPYCGMLVPCPNNRNNDGRIGRDKFVPNPSYTSQEHVQMFCFIGKIMGVCLRQGMPQPFNLPALVWKLIVGEAPDAADLEEVDAHLVKTNKTLCDCPEQDDAAFATKFGLRFTVPDASGQREVELVPGGARRRVRWTDRQEYARLSAAYRLQEFGRACAGIRAGLGTVVPLKMLDLWTWEELELEVCGRPGFDVELLRRHTHFQAYNARSSMARWIFRALASFTDQERERFLQFSWGRSRLPNSDDAGWTHRFTLSRGAGGDESLPSSHTCFFSVEFPAYSSYEVLRRNLSTAMTYSGIMSD